MVYLILLLLTVMGGILLERFSSISITRNPADEVCFEIDILPFINNQLVELLIKGGLSMVTITDLQKVTLRLTAKSKAGNTSTIPAGTPVTWKNSSPSIVDLVVSPDGLSAVASAVGPVGNSTVSVQAEIGDTLIENTTDISVTCSEPYSITVLAGNPESK